MRYGLIMSAGKERRFGANIPKSLSLINGEHLLDKNIMMLKCFCDDVFVVVSNENKYHFANYKTIVINSGFGCGDAVMKALSSINYKKSDTCIILWGDCICNENVLRETVLNGLGNESIVIPCHFEENPYVSINKSNGSINVLFSKYGEVKENSSAYHDFGLFYGLCYEIHNALFELSSKHKSSNGYVHKHGNEINFLDIFNETNITGRLIVFNDIVPQSFNTKEELYEIIK